MDADKPNLPDMQFEDKDIETCVFEAIGAASTCWENMSGTGIFQDGRAKHIGDQLMDRIKYEVVTVGPELCSTESIRPKEWIERQEEERRAWAINTSADIIKTADIWDEDSLINMAAKIEAFVKGSSDEDPDLHDQDAFDTWGLVTLELLSEVLFQKMTPDLANEQRDYIEDRLTDLSDALTKSGVRFKTGKVIED